MSDPKHPKEVILTVGISASGKSTWSKEFVKSMNKKRLDNPEVREWTIVERDNIRRTILNEKTKGSSGSKMVWGLWKFKWEKEVTQIQEKMINEAISCGVSVVISDTNLNVRTRESLTKKFKENGYQVTYRYFPIDYEEAVKRDASRENGVGSSVIAEQLVKWNEQFSKKYVGDPLLPKAVVVDVDGTLAKMKDRSPFEWDRVAEDELHRHVRDVVCGLEKMGYSIIIVSGRDGVCRELTESWLDKNQVPYRDFFMRQKGDSRSDVIVKDEIFWNEIVKNYNVVFWIDDRPKVCRKIRSLGIPVLQCGNPDIFF